MGSSAAAAKPAGKGGFVVALAVLTVFAIVAGGLVGKLVAARFQAVTASGDAAGIERIKPLPYASTTEVRELPAIVTNFATPAETRVRIQVAMVFAKGSIENPTLVGAKVNEDIVGYLTTLSVSQIQGPSGLQALREDLNERAKVRSDGKVRELIIETLVVQ